MRYNLRYLDFENNFNNELGGVLGLKEIEKHKKIVIDILNDFIK